MDDQVQLENELICEKLLGWKRSSWCEAPAGVGVITVDGWELPDKSVERTPSFTAWAEVGLILDVLAAQWPQSKYIFRGLGGSMCLGGITPGEIRAAALEYIKAVKS